MSRRRGLSLENAICISLDPVKEEDGAMEAFSLTKLSISLKASSITLV
ncbi:UNVERIFIED_ORG: hypothetical protein QOE_2891 [Clostridioides difficile F501]